MERINRAKERQDRYLECMQKVREGEEHYIPVLYCMVAEQGNPLLKQAAGLLAQAMGQMEVNRLLAFEERFRETTSVEWFIDWQRLDIRCLEQGLDAEEYRWLLRLGTLHPNGYFREKCMWELSQSPEELPYMLLRVNDWAAPVRELAVETACAMAPESRLDTLLYAMPFLEKAKRGGRRDGAKLQCLEELLSERIMGMLRALPCGERAQAVSKCCLRGRQGLYRTLFQNGKLSLEEAEAFLKWEKNASCQNQIMLFLLRSFPYDEERTERYLHDPCAVVRRRALECRYEHMKDAWDGLEEMLLDDNRGVREYAAWVLGRCRGLDAAAFYRECFAQDVKKHAFRKNVIAGLGESGSKEDGALLLPLLEQEGRVPRVVLKALFALLGTEGEELYWKYLFSVYPGEAKTAYRAAEKNRVRYGAETLYRAIRQTESPYNRKFLILLLIRENSWERLPFLLRLYHYEDEPLRYRIRRAVRKRSVYAKVTASQEQEIRRLLEDEELGIPAGLTEEILFDLRFVT